MTTPAPFARGVAPTAPTVFTASEPSRPLTFMTADELVARVLRQRPGRVIRARQAVASLDGSPDFPAVCLYAVDPRAAHRFAFDPTEFAADYIGHAAGPGAERPDQIQAALARVQSAGGLAA